MEQKLASVEKIIEIKDIEGADKISAAKVLGYWTVIKKGGFSVGDLAIFHNPDCIVDISNPVYAFLKGDGRLRVRKFRKQVSWGLVLSLSDFADKIDINSVVEGQDVSKEIGIVKYVKEIPVNLRGQVAGNFPSFLRKTDEERIQNYPAIINDFKDKLVYISIKADGTSETCYLKDDKFGVCSRNLELKEEEGSFYWQMARQFKIEEALKAFRAKYPGDYCCQFESVGPGINGNNMKLSEPSIRVFNLFSIDRQVYAHYETLVEFCMDNNLPMAEVIYAGKFDFTLEQLQEMANGAEYAPGVKAEGIVIRPIQEQDSEALRSRLSIKVISENYCLKHGE